MMLARRTHHNGYWCGCCRREWESSDWEDDITIEDFVNTIYTYRAEQDGQSDRFAYFSGLAYEKDGELLFSCNVTGGKTWETWELERPDGKTLEIYRWHRNVRPKQVELLLEKLPSRDEALRWLSSGEIQ